MSEKKTTVADIIATCERAAFRMALQPEAPMREHMRKVQAALAGRRFPLEDEKQTQAAIAAAFAEAGLTAEREVPVTGGVIDFVVTLSEPSPAPLRSMRFRHIGIEVKIKGGTAAIGRQLKGYAAEDGLDGIVLATSRPMAMPAEIGGKPVAVIDLGRAWL